MIRVLLAALALLALAAPSLAACATYEHAQKPWRVEWTAADRFAFYLGPDRMAVCTESEPMLASGQVPLHCEGATDSYESWYELFPSPDGTASGAMLWSTEIYYRRCS